MTKLARALGPATRALVLTSLVIALAGESWLARPVWRYLPESVALAGFIGLIGGRFAPWPTVAATLSLAYVAPLVAVLFLGRFTREFLLIWSAALAGVLVADRKGWQWAYPHRWRFALVLWALTVAIAWPITALREADFESLSLLQRYNIPNTGIGGSPTMVISWGMDTAIVHLLGLLWFEWLFRHARRVSNAAFQQWVAWPMAASIVAGSFLALYQGLFDLAFLSTGLWVSVRRASGPLMDANAYGAAAALWTAGLLAFVNPSPRQRVATLVGAAVCWGGLWMSGSRTALASASLALAVVGLAALTQTAGWRSRVRTLAAGAGVVALLAAGLLLMPASSASPLARLKRTLPAEASRVSVGRFAREMWNRNGYGEVATALIAQHPATGVGIGLFHLSGAAYPRAGGHLPPDNAQNWWRHQIAELGFVGAAGLLIWTVVFLTFLTRTSGSDQRRMPAAALKGAILGFVVASMFGMPAQSLPVTITFWTFAFWYTRLVVPAADEQGQADLSSAHWTLVLAIVGVYVLVLMVQARGAARPAMRAAEGQWRYTYGVYDPGGSAAPNETRRWTERHGVAVIPNEAPWMILTVRAEHPDIQQHPVQASVRINGRTILDRRIYTDDPIIFVVQTGASARAILETRVDRTWRPPGLPAGRPDVGLALTWRFAAEPPAGAPVITALLRR